MHWPAALIVSINVGPHNELTNLREVFKWCRKKKKKNNKKGKKRGRA